MQVLHRTIWNEHFRAERPGRSLTGHQPNRVRRRDCARPGPPARRRGRVCRTGPGIGEARAERQPLGRAEEKEYQVVKTPHLRFHDGNSIPQLGFGIWQVPADETAAAVCSALEQGYRMIDGAYIYMNEAGLGEGLRRSGVARDDVFITTKVWNDEQGRDKARASVERSLEAIGVDQLDLVLIHWPVPRQDLYVETWEAFIEMRDKGLMRSIGVSNFNPDHLERIIAETGEVPVLNQIELNPELQQPNLRAVNARHGIVTQAWTPLGNGRSFGADPIAAAAARTGKSPAQIIIRWHIQLGNAVIPRSVNPNRQMENIDVFDFELTAGEMEAIGSLDAGMRTGSDPAIV